MDLQKAKILLEKINSLHKSMSTDVRNVSTIEKDLMRSYVRQLYECFLDLPAAATTLEAPAVEIIKSTPKPPLQNRPEPAPAPRQEAAPAPPPPPPLEVKKPAPPPPPPPVEEPAPPPPPPPVMQAPTKPTPPPPVVTPAEPVAAPPFAGSDELDELFSFANAKELSEKLANQPIADLKKAMGLNERIFTVNELFGGVQAVFDETMATLNQFNSFEEAKQYLIRNVAAKYEWRKKTGKARRRLS